MADFQGKPCWYELSTSEPPSAGDFYTKVLGWSIQSAGMEGYDYDLATSGQEMVAGIAAAMGDQPPHWLTYFGSGDCDADARAFVDAGGKVLTGPQDIPGTGRFAICADPQGARFGILQPDMSRMSEADRKQAETTGAFDQKKPGHGNWHELMTTDPEAAFGFYAARFGWTKSTALDMGDCPEDGSPGGIYQIFAYKGQDIGAVMGLGDAPKPVWLPYFGTEGVEAAMARIRDAGGTIQHGPHEVPGGAFIAIATDPQGAWFAVVGPK